MSRVTAPASNAVLTVVLHLGGTPAEADATLMWLWEHKSGATIDLPPSELYAFVREGLEAVRAGAPS